MVFCKFASKNVAYHLKVFGSSRCYLEYDLLYLFYFHFRKDPPQTKGRAFTRHAIRWRHFGLRSLLTGYPLFSLLVIACNWIQLLWTFVIKGSALWLGSRICRLLDRTAMNSPQRRQSSEHSRSPGIGRWSDRLIFGERSACTRWIPRQVFDTWQVCYHNYFTRLPTG